MRAARGVIALIAILALLCGAVFLAARPALLNWGSVARTGWGTDSFDQMGLTPGGLAAAADWREEGICLSFFTAGGERLGSWQVQLPDEETGGSIGAVYPMGEDRALLAVYSANAEHLTLYRVNRGGVPERLMREICRGTSSAERRNGTRLYAFSQDGDQVCFALLAEGEVRAYQCGMDTAGVVQTDAQARQDAGAAAVLPDGTLALGGDGWLVMDGSQAPADVSGQQVTYMTRTGPGLYYLDGSTLELWFTDFTGSDARMVLSLAQVLGERRLTAMAVTASGEALLLVDGHTLIQTGESGSVECTGLLYGSRGAAIACLAGIGAACLAAALVIWYLACGRRGARLPLAAYWGVVLAALVLAVFLALGEGIVRPEQSRTALSADRAAVESVVRLVRAQSDSGAEALPELAAQSLEAAQERFRNVSAMVAGRSGEGWETPDGIRGEAQPAFDAGLAARALESGSAGHREDGRLRVAIALEGEQVLFLCLDVQGGTPALLLSGMTAGAVLLVAVFLLILLVIGCRVRQLSRGMEMLSSDSWRRKPLKMRSGDEFEVMASSLNSLADALKRRDQERDAVARAYRRFVPERVLALLGKQTILDVDKNTFASRRMAVMMVRFVFPEPVYNASNSRLLFDSVNQVIERTASIAAQKNGTVFNFAYNGYDVVMPEDLPQVVSTAVAIQQEVLAFNETRSRDGLPTVEMHIALDVGDVMLGVVGDSSQMEPTTISTSFSTVRELIGLGGRLEAGVLCTEAIIAGAEHYGSRYLGKCWLDQEPVRVYEIFDGDSYGLRKGKESTQQRFSRGIFLLYSGEKTQAKRMFLELAHDNPGDGAARYYLYLADRMEQDPGQACNLNGFPADRRGGQLDVLEG